MKLSLDQDAQGRQIYESFKGKGDGMEIVERDDGFINAYSGHTYLSQYKDWPRHQKKAIRFAKGRVLDVGCGAGRHSLYLQAKGLHVLGIDISPFAIKACKLRGLRNARVMSFDELGPGLGKFDTVLMLGNNFGVFGNMLKARRLLRRLREMTNPGAKILAESLEIYKPPVDPAHRSYHAMNRRRGRMPGQVRIRIRYKAYTTPWFDYLLASKNEMRRILDGTGWRVGPSFSSKGPQYIAVLERSS